MRPRSNEPHRIMSPSRSPGMTAFSLDIGLGAARFGKHRRTMPACQPSRACRYPRSTSRSDVNAIKLATSRALVARFAAVTHVVKPHFDHLTAPIRCPRCRTPMTCTVGELKVNPVVRCTCGAVTRVLIHEELQDPALRQLAADIFGEQGFSVERQW